MNSIFYAILLTLMLDIPISAMAQSNDNSSKIGDALRCAKGKCVSKPNDGPVIVQLLKTIHEQDVKLSQQQARIQAMEKALANKEAKGRKK